MSNGCCMPHLSDAYLAGLFDGEGSIGIYVTPGCKDGRYRSGHRPPSWVRTVSIANTNHALLDEVLQVSGLGIIRAKSATTFTTKPMYWWALSSKADIAKFLSRILPYLYDKREQARVMLLEAHGEISTTQAAKFLKQAKRMKS